MDPASGKHHGRWRASLALAFTTFALFGCATSLALAEDSPEPLPDVEAQAVPGELVVGFNEEFSPSQQRKAVKVAGGRIDEVVDLIDGAVVVSRPGRTTDEIAANLADSEAVRFVEPNYLFQASRLPSDVALAKLWAIRNTGQLGGKIGADISAPAAWDLVTGSDVTVAVIDTGIDYRHPDLDGNVWINRGEVVDGADNDGNGYADDLRGIDLVTEDSDPWDDSGHGTHVAGIAGAEGNNFIGVAGVSWRLRLMPLKFLDSHGEGNTADAAEAIDYAIDNGASIINASWGGPAYSQALAESVRKASDKGILFVAAAGNDGANGDAAPEYPASYDLPNVISVAASDPDDQLLYFSNYGRRTVDIAAPGDEIYSTVPARAGQSAYATFSGTSMAAPYVSGGAALYLARYPGTPAQKLREALLASADPLPSLAGKTVTGGRLDLARALGIAPDPAAGSTESPARDQTAPSPFRLLEPRDKYLTRKRGLRFRWQRSHDAGGIRYYKLFIDGRRRKTIRDPDRAASGRDPKTKTFVKLDGGRHSWQVRAYDYAGNHRTASVASRARGTRRVLFIKKKRRGRARSARRSL